MKSITINVFLSLYYFNFPDKFKKLFEKIDLSLEAFFRAVIQLETFSDEQLKPFAAKCEVDHFNNEIKSLTRTGRAIEDEIALLENHLSKKM